jgi:hypothetical protein
MGFNASVAIFEMYGRWYDSYQYMTFQIGINVSESGVTFVGDPQEVVLLTKIVPQGAKTTPTPVPTPTPTTQEENNMTENTTQATVQTTTPSESTQSVTPAPVTTPVAQAAEPKKVSVQEYIAQAPAEVQDVLKHSLRMHEAHKANLIEGLKAHKGNKFSDEQLKAFDVGMLEQLTALAGAEQIAPNYGGVAPATPVVHAQEEAIPAPPRLFAANASNAA